MLKLFKHVIIKHVVGNKTMFQERQANTKKLKTFKKSGDSQKYK